MAGKISRNLEGDRIMTEQENENGKEQKQWLQKWKNTLLITSKQMALKKP